MTIASAAGLPATIFLMVLALSGLVAGLIFLLVQILRWTGPSQGAAADQPGAGPPPTAVRRRGEGGP